MEKRKRTIKGKRKRKEIESSTTEDERTLLFAFKHHIAHEIWKSTVSFSYVFSKILFILVTTRELLSFIRL
mgnify:CR=1 FL=1